MSGDRTESWKLGGEAGRLNLEQLLSAGEPSKLIAAERSQRDAARLHGSRDPR